jgi:hypothetical protein
MEALRAPGGMKKKDQAIAFAANAKRRKYRVRNRRRE